MSEEREPIRLRDDPAEDPKLRELLDAARGEVAPDAMLDRVLAGVLASGGGGGGGSSGGGAATGKIVATTIAAAVGIAAVAMVASQLTSPVVVPTTTTIAVDAFVATDAAPDVDAVVIADAGSSEAIDAFVVHARVQPPPSETDEALMLRVMREHDPALSLGLALEHRARFPNSAMSEDREAIVVIDLATLHRPSARDAADAFRARWPHSTHLTHIDAALARATP